MKRVLVAIGLLAALALIDLPSERPGRSAGSESHPPRVTFRLDFMAARQGPNGTRQAVTRRAETLRFDGARERSGSYWLA